MAAYNVANFADLQAALSSTDNNIDITITSGFTMTGLASIPAGKTVTITSDAGGPYIITRGAGVTGNLFTVPSGSSLSLTNIILDGNKGVVTGTSSALIRDNGGTVTLNSGAVVRNNANINLGGGIYNTTNGILNIHSGSNGGGIYNDNGATINMDGGIITGNAANQGGGIYNTTSSSSSFPSTVNMTGGSVEFNTATSGGGGIANNVRGILNLYTGASISNNLAAIGGGIYNIGSFIMNNGSILSNNA